MKRLLIAIKKKVDPSHKLIATEHVTDDELKEIRQKYAVRSTLMNLLCNI